MVIGAATWRPRLRWAAREGPGQLDVAEVDDSRLRPRLGSNAQEVPEEQHVRRTRGTQFARSAAEAQPRLPGVSMVPGKTLFAVTPRSLFSSATVRIDETSAAFDALYAPAIGAGSTPCRLATAMIRPLP